MTATAAGTALSYNRGVARCTLGNAGAAAGDMAAILNDSSTDRVIYYAALDITTASTGASTIDVGVGSSASTSYDNLIDGHSGATAGVFAAKGTNGLLVKVWTAGQYITVSEASGDVSGLAGELHIKYYERAGDS